MDDEALLLEYVARDSETAFRALVERYGPLVYGAALRQVENPSLAEDVTQVVFIILARKAARLPQGTVLSGWLYRATRFTAGKAKRAEYRREQREHQAMQMPAASTNSDWSQLAPVLDDAMAQLGENDRSAILLRFFENKSLKDVGRVMGISEDTAQKRISRAIVKLRGVLVKEGVAVSATTMTTAISTHAAPAISAKLSDEAVAAALGQGTISATVQNLAETAMRPWFSLKIISGVSAGLAILVIALVITFHPSARHSMRPSAASPNPGGSQIVVRVPPSYLPAEPGRANIRFNFAGTPGLRFDVVYVHDGQTQTASGILPGEISFRADAFTATITVHGPGQFGYDAYRNNRLLSWSNAGPVTNVNRFEIKSLAGGQGVRFRSLTANAAAGN
jgi:RNA polymerase sigma factor (sigma-70 family)